MKMRWWRLLAVPVAASLVVAGGCAVGGGRDAPTKSTALVVPPAPLSPARVRGPLVGVVSSDSVATELARLDPRTLRPLPGGRLKLEGTWPMMTVASDGSVAVLGSELGDLAYVQLMDANLGTAASYAVMDLRSGRVLSNGTGDAPALLIPDR